ncbi:hypothetical protein [Pseudomonas cichorii]|uniref:Uncharacterized protein n=1 Tax=Pseudomonas cichorii TaxID=36746 RepID=A0ABQ1DS51_PSECI|nr:hypothetical protein [Pseudomonas cichorii]AHF70151.1 hypothetical protein PCH70_49980 [Pseudomonas cichorii JBC1]MBX8532490.1 hypothetical protein [Pseudomonas cichorii]QVE17035.1 hypothetical protein KGD89_24970 [Pseudomonas cichorii]SDO80237.1 hypothetical protein SAMN05216599_113105 [Pseudomonas cichorii]GFM78524.1 hypothetical protein PSCICM_43430 [Pseudomonas cichorii]
MALNKPNQDLRRDLQGVASDLKWSAVELMRIAERLSTSGNEPDAQAVLRICTVMQAGEEKLQGVTNEVSLGRLVRARS